MIPFLSKCLNIFKRDVSIWIVETYIGLAFFYVNNVFLFTNELKCTAKFSL